MWCSISSSQVAVAIAGAANVTRDVRGRELLRTTNGGVFAANQEYNGAGDVEMEMWRGHKLALKNSSSAAFGCRQTAIDLSTAIAIAPPWVLARHNPTWSGSGSGFGSSRSICIYSFQAASESAAVSAVCRWLVWNADVCSCSRTNGQSCGQHCGKLGFITYAKYLLSMVKQEFGPSSRI